MRFILFTGIVMYSLGCLTGYIYCKSISHSIQAIKSEEAFPENVMYIGSDNMLTKIANVKCNSGHFDTLFVKTIVIVK